jgi:hypothetical protein
MPRGRPVSGSGLFIPDPDMISLTTSNAQRREPHGKSRHPPARGDDVILAYVIGTDPTEVCMKNYRVEPGSAPSGITAKRAGLTEPRPRLTRCSYPAEFQFLTLTVPVFPAIRPRGRAGCAADSSLDRIRSPPVNNLGTRPVPAVDVPAGHELPRRRFENVRSSPPHTIYEGVPPSPPARSPIRRSPVSSSRPVRAAADRLSAADLCGSASTRALAPQPTTATRRRRLRRRRGGRRRTRRVRPRDSVYAFYEEGGWGTRTQPTPRRLFRAHGSARRRRAVSR